MNKPLYLFVGRSASGKTSIASLLEEKCGMSQVQSYTTRPRRYYGEVGHVFISESQFNKLKNIVAYTEYNSFHYCATKEQIDCADIYVVDVPGVETLMKKYDSNRPIVIMYFDASVRTRIDRMFERGDHDTAIIARLYVDEEFDWQDELNKIVWNAKHNDNRNVEMYVIDANKDIDNVMGQMMSYINSGKEID